MEVFVRRCEVCCRYRHGPRTKQGQLQYAPVSTVMQKMHIDLTGPHVRSKNGYVYLLTAICSFSKYLIAVPLRDKTALSVAKALVNHVYLRYGAVQIQVHDGGTEFCNEINNNLNRLMGIQGSVTTPYRPSSNGSIERVHASINSVFAKIVNQNQRNWCEMVPYVVFSYNTAYHTSTTFSPFYLMFLRDPVVGLDLLTDKPSPELPDNLDDYTELMAERMRAAYAVVSEQLNCVFSRAKQRYDQRVKSMQFAVGSLVWYYNPRKRPGLGRKW